MKWICALLFILCAGPMVAQTPAPAALPKPKGLRAITETPHTAIYLAGGSPEALRDRTVESFVAKGWEPYGEAGDTRYFKKGKLKGLVTVSTHPSQPGKVTVSYQVEAMSADLPLPKNVTGAQYSDTTKTLGFTTTASPDELTAEYGRLLAAAKWGTKMTKPQKDDFTWVMIYRHPTEGKVELSMHPGDTSMYATAKYQIPAKGDAEEARAKKGIADLRERHAAEAAAGPPTVEIPIPARSTRNFAVQNGYAIVLEPGAAQDGAKAIAAALEAQGWKRAPQAAPPAKETGFIELTRDDRRFTITYMDPGYLPAEITIGAPNLTIRPKP